MYRRLCINVQLETPKRYDVQRKSSFPRDIAPRDREKEVKIAVAEGADIQYIESNSRKKEEKKRNVRIRNNIHVNNCSITARSFRSNEFNFDVNG